MSSPDFLPPLHPPGRSRTRSAWVALLSLLLMVLVIIFHPFLLRTSVRSLFWITRPITGFTLTSKKMEVTWGKPLQWHEVTIRAGKSPHESTLYLKELSIGLSTPKRFFLGDHHLFNSLQASEGTGLIDLRTETSLPRPYFFQQLVAPLILRLQHKIESFPKNIDLHHISLVVITEGERYSITDLSCHLPQKTAGYLSYTSILIEAGIVRCNLAEGNCEALWDGKEISLHNLPLSDEIKLQRLTIAPHADRIEWGLVSQVFQGLLRADGSLHNNPSGLLLDGAVLAEHLPLERLSHFLGLKKNISGNLKEGRLTFRGSSLHLIDAEASLRLLADNIRWGKKGGASLSVTANFIGHKISITDFQLRQHENCITASGEMALPEEWRKIAHSPFLLKLKATIADASQLLDLVESPENNITGKLFVEGEVHGAANHAEGYLNAQGAGMTAYKIPINSLKLQLLFQGEKAELANLDLWSGADRLQLSGTMEHRWPHHYEGKGSLHSNNLSEKLVPLFRLICSAIPEKGSLFSYLHHLENTSLLEKLHHGLLQVSWKGTGQASLHSGNVDLLLNEPSLLKGHLSGSYGSDHFYFPTLTWEENQRKGTASLLLSQQGITLQNLLLQDHGTSLLSGDAFVPVNAFSLLQQLPFSEALLPKKSLSINLQLHQLSLPKESLLIKSLPSLESLSGKIQATGLLTEPLLQVALKGGERSPNAKKSHFSMTLEAKKGTGFIDTIITQGEEKLLSLNGSLPVAFILEKESAPLKEETHWKIGSSTAPINLKLFLSKMPLDQGMNLLEMPPFHLSQGVISGELLCKGTLSEPQPLGHLEFQAKEMTLGKDLHPLQSLQGKLLFTKEKMELADTTAFMENEKVTASGTTEWHHYHHNYHLSGQHLPFYHSSFLSLIGDTSLDLQGEGNEGSLQGNIKIQEIVGSPQLFITPFLTPPGIITPLSDLSPSSDKASFFGSWITDIAITKASKPLPLLEKNGLSSLAAMDLRLVGSLLAPALEGSISLLSLPLCFPKAEMKVTQGSCYFHASQPWIPDFQLTATGTVEGLAITAKLLGTPNNPSLQLESIPFIPPSTLAMLLRSGGTHADLGWITELPFWIRQQQYETPISLSEPANALSSETNWYYYLGFTGGGIAYSAELK